MYLGKTCLLGFSGSTQSFNSLSFLPSDEVTGGLYLDKGLPLALFEPLSFKVFNGLLMDGFFCNLRKDCDM